MATAGGGGMRPAEAQELATVRAEIEAVDAVIVDALARRMALARVVRGVKVRAGHPVLDPAREAEVVARVGARARGMGCRRMKCGRSTGRSWRWRDGHS